tara:strand:- start:1454 stop:2452 length:999 start_codon:yes stop_codon:yes gene_type:complete
MIFRAEKIAYLSGLTLLLTCLLPLIAEEKQEPETDDSKVEIMRHLLNAWSIRTKEKRTEPLRFVQDPVMQYHDPRYKVTKGAIWRLGEKGRPRAYVAVEMDHPEETAGRATFEFVSMSEGPFRIEGQNVSWQPWEVEAKFQPYPEGPVPADTPEGRLDQMEQMAIKFSAEEMLGRELIHLNLHPTPFDRYQITDDEKSDAAVFFFERGFNPEVFLIFETDGKTWNYGCARLSAAANLVKLDGKEVWSCPKISVRPKEDQIRYQWTNGYTANRHVFRLPRELGETQFRFSPGQPVPARVVVPKIKPQPKPVKPEAEKSEPQTEKPGQQSKECC